MDVPVVRRHLASIRAALANLRRHRGATVQALVHDPDLRWAIERGLQLCAQGSLDVATHIASAAGLDATDYATAIDRLVEAGVIPADFGAEFRQVAGFRNVLVHGYLEVDLEIVASVLAERLEEFEAFARHVEDSLDR